MILNLIYLILGLGILFLGATSLVKGAASLAERLGVSTLVVGLTVVSFGTSMPELIVSTQAALEGFGSISIGNVVGSNIVNIGLILGLSAIIYPLRADMQLIRFDTPVMLLSALLFYVFFLDQRIARIEGLVFLIAIVAYTAYNVIKSKNENKENVLEEFSKSVPKKSRHWALDIFFIAFGVAALILGADLLVKNAVNLAKMMEISDAVIGLTIVAIGTGTPELATSLVAAIRKQPDIAIGNVVGSNIFNVLGILGVTSLIKPISSTEITQIDFLVMIFLTLLLLPFIKTGFTLRRWEGVLLLLIYIVYTVYLLY